MNWGGMCSLEPDLPGCSAWWRALRAALVLRRRWYRVLGVATGLRVGRALRRRAQLDGGSAAPMRPSSFISSSASVCTQWPRRRARGRVQSGRNDDTPRMRPGMPPKLGAEANSVERRLSPHIPLHAAALSRSSKRGSRTRDSAVEISRPSSSDCRRRPVTSFGWIRRS